MHDLLCKFENIIILKTIMESVDRNFIDTVDLGKIANVANELEIDLNFLDYDRIERDNQFDLIEQVYYDWFEDVNTMYLDIKNGLLKQL